LNTNAPNRENTKSITLRKRASTITEMPPLSSTLKLSAAQVLRMQKLFMKKKPRRILLGYAIGDDYYA